MRKRFSRRVVDFVLKNTNHWQKFGITCSADLENENVLIVKDDTKLLSFIAKRLRDGKFAKGTFYVEDGTAGLSVTELTDKEIEFIAKHATVNQ